MSDIAHVRGPAASRPRAVTGRVLALAASLLLAVACGPAPAPGEPGGGGSTGTAPPLLPGDAGSAPSPDAGASPGGRLGADGAPQLAGEPTGAEPGAPGAGSVDTGAAGGGGPPEPPAPPAGAPPGGGGSGGAPAPTDAAAAAGGAPQPTAAALPDERGEVGAMCRTYLRAGVPRLVVEIDAQAGAELSPGAVEHLLDALGAVVDKPGGVALAGASTIAGGPRTWTLDALRDAAAANRDHHTTAEAAVVHVLAVRGQMDSDAIGVAFSATEAAIFPDRIDALAALLGGQEAVERAVLVHEAGHLLCLVGIDYDSEIPHEDPAHPGHSSDRASVMFHAIETSAIAQLFTGPPPDRFAPADLADLEALRSGRY